MNARSILWFSFLNDFIYLIIKTLTPLGVCKIVLKLEDLGLLGLSKGNTTRKQVECQILMWKWTVIHVTLGNQMQIKIWSGEL